MEEKEVEKRLKESAENIEVRDFSEVWQDIEHKVQPPKKRRYVRLFSGIAAALSVIICAVFIPLFFNPAPEQSDNSQSDNNQTVEPPEQIYLEDELFIVEVNSEEFLSQLSESSVNLVDISNYVISSSYLHKTTDQKVLGGRVELTDDLDNPTFFLALQIYHQSVQSSRPTVDYDYNYTVEGTVIEYRVKEVSPEDGGYIYDIKAKYLQTNYYMEYTCFSEDITSFLTDFFT